MGMIPNGWHFYTALKQGRMQRGMPTILNWIALIMCLIIIAFACSIPWIVPMIEKR